MPRKENGTPVILRSVNVQIQPRILQLTQGQLSGSAGEKAFHSLSRRATQLPKDGFGQQDGVASVTASCGLADPGRVRGAEIEHLPQGVRL